MEIGLAVCGTFLSLAFKVLFDRLAPKGDLLKMFHKHTNDVRLLNKLWITLSHDPSRSSDCDKHPEP